MIFLLLFFVGMNSPSSNYSINCIGNTYLLYSYSCFVWLSALAVKFPRSNRQTQKLKIIFFDDVLEENFWIY